MGSERSTNSVDVRLGQRVRMRRLQLGMSQERLADLLGVTFQQVQKYEKGVNRIAASRLLDISAALETSVGQMYDGIAAETPIGYGRPSAFLDQVLATSEGVQLVKLFSEIRSLRVRRRIVALVRAMSETQS